MHRKMLKLKAFGKFYMNILMGNFTDTLGDMKTIRNEWIKDLETFSDKTVHFHITYL